MPTQRIHIVGPQRSGTTLMQALFGTCFDIDGVTTQEERLWRRGPAGERVLMTKRPGDEVLAPTLLPVDPNLWFVFMLRDPRDVVVSEHGREPGKYWSNLRVWRQSLAVYQKLKDHPRFIVVRYEDMVTAPDKVQEDLVRRMPFLKTTVPFSHYHEHVSQAAAQSGQFNRAMRGIRPVTTESIGAWRAHLPRVKAQLMTHGGVSDDLVATGYEKDNSWRQILDNVEQDGEASMVPDRLSPWIRIERATGHWVHSLLYLWRRYVPLAGGGSKTNTIKCWAVAALGMAPGP